MAGFCYILSSMTEGPQKLRMQRSPKSTRSETLILKDGKKISAGGGMATGGVFQAEGQFEGDWRRRKMPVVIKAYERSGHEIFPSIAETHKSALKDKIRVPRTLRYNVEEGMIVLTDLNARGHVALSFNNPSELIAENSLTELPGFEQTAKDIFTHAAYAASKNYAILADGYFVMVPTKEKEKTDFVVGDLQSLVKRTEPDPPGMSLRVYNLKGARRFLDGFCRIWLTEDVQERYLDMIEKIEAGIPLK